MTVDHVSIGDESSILVGGSYGDTTGSRPEMSVAYDSAIASINKDDGDVAQGVLAIDVSSLSNNADIYFHDIVNINDGSSMEAWSWNGVAIDDDGTFSSTTGGNIDGTFYGTGHREIGGTFNWNGIIGAFGGTIDLQYPKPAIRFFTLGNPLYLVRSPAFSNRILLWVI